MSYLKAINVVKFFSSKRNNKKKRKIAGIHQFSSATSYDRYPGIFSALAERVTPKRVLSFGCSTGKECASIKYYWPDAEISGVDVNEDSLAAARQDYPFARFHHAKALPDLGPFDLVFAMSVLCRHPDTMNKDNIAEIYPFAQFEEAVGTIVNALTADGIMVIFNANYRFEDTRWAPDFRVMFDDEFQDEGLETMVRKFAPDGRVLDDQHAASVFQSGKST